MDDTYDTIITLQVKIPAALIEGEMTAPEYEEIEERMLADAECQLQSVINQFREVHTRG